jgi:hypothetical protein
MKPYSLETGRVVTSHIFLCDKHVENRRSRRVAVTIAVTGLTRVASDCTDCKLERAVPPDNTLTSLRLVSDDDLIGMLADVLLSVGFRVNSIQIGECAPPSARAAFLSKKSSEEGIESHHFGVRVPGEV